MFVDPERREEGSVLAILFRVDMLVRYIIRWSFARYIVLLEKRFIDSSKCNKYIDYEYRFPGAENTPSAKCVRPFLT